MEFDATTIYCELERSPKLCHHCRLFASLATSGICVMHAAAKKRGWMVPDSTPPDYYKISLELAWIRNVGLPVSRSRPRYLYGRWDRELAHNSNYDVAKTLELLLHL
eukprot:COSAG01_NODE_1570_length_9869_cov_360.007267_9_plen_107_part_00